MSGVLVVAAHPDDEVLGAGGVMPKLAKRPGGLHIAILGEGVTSRPGLSDAERISALSQLKRNAEDVAKLVGAASLTLEGLPDNRFDTVPLLDIVQRVERLIDRLSPTAIFTHHPGDLNVDHATTFRAVLTATRPVASCPVRELYTFEVPSSTEWAFQQLQPTFRPNVFIDITDEIETKVKAMSLYEGEARQFPHPRSGEALRGLARRWGAVVGRPYVEAFELVRSIRTDE
jgi:LmbE family N-acetylglucosaminyl deacetylase